MTDRSEANRASDDLVERVEAVIARQMMKTVPYEPGDRMYLNVARAAIAVVLEEAAKVAENSTEPNPFPTRQGAIAAAIRALVKEG